MACFSGLESRKPSLQTTHHHPFSRPESWKPSIPRSKIQAFQDSSHENTSPSEATCHFQDSTLEKTPPEDGWPVFRDWSHENHPCKPPQKFGHDFFCDFWSSARPKNILFGIFSGRDWKLVCLAFELQGKQVCQGFLHFSTPLHRGPLAMDCAQTKRDTFLWVEAHMFSLKFGVCFNFCAKKP